MQVNGFTFGELPAAPTFTHAKAWDGDGLDFDDLLDVVNPLQHLPVVSSFYRDGFDDEIGGIPRLFGGLLFGGPLGLIAAAVNFAIEAITGRDLGDHVTGALFGRADPVLGREDRMQAWQPDGGWQPTTTDRAWSASYAYRRAAGLVVTPQSLRAAAYDA